MLGSCGDNQLTSLQRLAGLSLPAYLLALYRTRCYASVHNMQKNRQKYMEKYYKREKIYIIAKKVSVQCQAQFLQSLRMESEVYRRLQSQICYFLAKRQSLQTGVWFVYVWVRHVGTRVHKREEASEAPKGRLLSILCNTWTVTLFYVTTGHVFVTHFIYVLFMCYNVAHFCNILLVTLILCYYNYCQ